MRSVSCSFCREGEKFGIGGCYGEPTTRTASPSSRYARERVREGGRVEKMRNQLTAALHHQPSGSSANLEALLLAWGRGGIGLLRYGVPGKGAGAAHERVVYASEAATRQKLVRFGSRSDLPRF